MFHLDITLWCLLAWQSSGITLVQNPADRRRTSHKTTPITYNSLSHGSNTSQEFRGKGASLAQSGNKALLNQKLNQYISTLSSMKKNTQKGKAAMFDMTKCLMDSATGKLSDLSYEGTQTCGHTFSCVGVFHMDVALELVLGMYCSLIAYETNEPPDVRKPIDEQYYTMLSTVLVPLWVVMMDMNTMIKDEPTYKPGFLQRKDCTAEKSGMDKMKCMMTQTRMMFDARGGKLDLTKLSMTDEQAVKMQSNFKHLHSSLQLLQTLGSSGTQKAKLRALEQGGEAMGAGDAIGPETLYSSPKDDVPIEGPMTDSLISPPSASRFAHVLDGLKMKAHYLADSIPEAKCNDGSSAIYYLNEGTEDCKFHFHVAGGYFCNSERNCRKRIRVSPMLASTKGYDEMYDGSGIFDPVNGGLPGWTHSYVTYCSSDAWFGQVDLPFQVVNNTYISPGVTGTFFRGYTMVDAMLKKYAAMGLGTKPTCELVVSGCSAGGIGMAAQADSLQSRLQKEFTGLYPDVAFYFPKLTVVLDNMPIVVPKPVALNFNGNISLFEQSQQLVDMLYVKPGILDKAGEFLNKQCTAANADNPGACVFPAVVMPHIQTPNLIMNNLQDSFLMFNPHAILKPATPEQEKWMYGVDTLLRAAIKTVTPQQNQWAIGCNDHCLMLFAIWWRMKPPSAPGGMHMVSSKDMMIMTMKGDTGKIAMDDCHSFNCGCAGAGPYYYMEMVSQYCSQRTYNMFPQSVAVLEDYYDYYLRLPKDPFDMPPKPDGTSFIEKASSALEVSTSSSSQAAMGDICLAYTAFTGAQAAYGEVLKARFEKKMGITH